MPVWWNNMSKMIFSLSSHSWCIFFCQNISSYFSDNEVPQYPIQHTICSTTYKCCNSPEKFFIFILIHDIQGWKIYCACCAWFFLIMCIKDASVEFLIIVRPVTWIKSAFILLMPSDNTYVCTVLSVDE